MAGAALAGGAMAGAALAGGELGPQASTGGSPAAAPARPYGRILIFTLLDDRVADFDRLAEQMAEEIRLGEPDTLVYVIHLVPNAPMQRIFYEIYRDRAAFESHESRPYMQRFVAERRSCVLATNVIELRLKYAKVAPLPNPQVSAPAPPALPPVRPQRPDQQRTEHLQSHQLGGGDAVQAGLDEMFARPLRPDPGARRRRPCGRAVPDQQQSEAGEQADKGSHGRCPLSPRRHDRVDDTHRSGELRNLTLRNVDNSTAVKIGVAAVQDRRQGRKAASECGGCTRPCRVVTGGTASR